MAGCRDNDTIEIVTLPGFLDDVSQVATVPATAQNRNIKLRVYGLEGALDVSSRSGWNKRLTVMIPALPAVTQRGHFFLQGRSRVTINYFIAGDSASDLDETYNRISRSQNIPIVLLSPPATFGSEGQYIDIHSQEGIDLLDSALNNLIEIFGAEEIVLSGQSAAGALVAILANMRNDVTCAVITSAPLDFGAHDEFNDAYSHYLGAAMPINPIETIVPRSEEHSPIFFIGYSETDQIVGQSYQINYAQQLASAGYEVHLDSAQAIDNYGHDLSVWRIQRTLECAI